MLQAYHNDQSLKNKTVIAMKADIKAERLVKGHYWRGDDKKGNGARSRHYVTLAKALVKFLSEAKKV